MRSNPISPEQRQHINLSQYAYDIIRNDSINFLGTLNYSGFINTVIENTKVESFEDYVLMEEERIIKELSDHSRSGSTIALTDSEKKTIHKIASAHRTTILNNSKNYPKNKTLKIRLNNLLYEYFYSSDTEWSGGKYGLSQGEYIKTLIEEYARKTYYERESIFYKERIELLNSNISSKDNEKRILEITMKTGIKRYCKLYRLSENYETHYHYLIGLFADDGTSEYRIASIRLSQIAEIKARARSLGSGKITAKEARKIEERIKDSDIQYLIGEPKLFTIKLTPLGMIMYDYKFSERPVYDDLVKNDPDGTYIMQITATERQIKNYFFAFGKEAIILQPNNMIDWMRERFNLAADAYNSSDIDR